MVGVLWEEDDFSINVFVWTNGSMEGSQEKEVAA